MSDLTDNPDLPIDDDGDDNYVDEASVAYWCYQCEAEINATLDSGTPTCPRCGSEFVAEMDGGESDNSYDHDGSLGETAAINYDLRLEFLRQLQNRNSFINFPQFENNGADFHLNFGGRDQQDGVSGSHLSANQGGESELNAPELQLPPVINLFPGPNIET
ncbi:hypothetical protein HK096_007399 [Nowakowskiella sp. JEL0078]|nr:hypothetical protein HK096_007399 [Nowakowskiella sp. JEL0078]